MNESSRVLATLVLVSAGGCVAPANSLVMGLIWSPISDVGEVSTTTSLTAFGEQRVRIQPFTDARPAPEIGWNVELSHPRRVMASDDVAAFVTAQVVGILQANHTSLVPSGETRQIKGRLTKFSVQEDSNYDGTVALTLSLLDGAGKQLWQGVAEGHAKRHGRSFSEDNYNETLSEAVIDAMKGLMRDSRFLEAVRG